MKDVLALRHYISKDRWEEISYVRCVSCHLTRSNQTKIFFLFFCELMIISIEMTASYHFINGEHHVRRRLFLD